MLILTHPIAAAAAAVVEVVGAKTATTTTKTAKPLTATLNNNIHQTNTKLISRFRIARINAASSSSRMQSLHISVLLLIIAFWCCVELPTHCVAIGYSYSRFVGPVSGPEHKVLVYDAASGGSHVDFMAKPEYAFAYGVEDGTTRVLQNRQETREGDAVKGVYSVVDPDGTLRVVKYTADDVNGFQAEIITNGAATNHAHDDNKQNYDATAAAHNANGKDTAANWQMVHGLQPPRLHEVQHVVGGGESLQAVDGNDATIKHDGSSKHNNDANDDYDQDEYSDDDANEAVVNKGGAVKGNQKQAESEENNDYSSEEDGDYYEDAKKEEQSYEAESDEYY